MVISKYIKRCQGIIQSRGWHGLCKFIFTRIVRCSGDLVFEKTLIKEESLTEKKLDKNYTVFIINSSNLKKKENQWLVKSIFQGENLEYLEGLQKKDCLVAIATESKVVHISFVQFETSYKKILNETNATPLIGNCWTSPEHRGKGLYPYAIACCCREIVRKGYQRIIISCDPKNFSSIAGIKKAGFKNIKKVKNISILTKIYLQKSVSIEKNKKEFKIGII